jgi:predicted permease
MRFAARIIIGFRNLLHKRDVEKGLDDEIRGYVDLVCDERVAEGMSQAEARHTALAELGGTESVKQAVRDKRAGTATEMVWQDVRYGVRQLRKSPGFTVVAVLTLALGIGANTALFTVINAAMLKLLPVSAPEQLVQLLHNHDDDSFTTALWRQMRAQQDVFSSVFAYQGRLFDTARGGEKHLVPGLYVSGGYFSSLGVNAALGRVLTDSDDRRGAAPVAVISYPYWLREYHGDPGVLSRSISVDKQLFQIVGVTPPGFFGTDVGYQFDVAVPLEAERFIEPGRPALDDPGTWWLFVIGRLKPGVTLAQAQARMKVLSPSIDRGALPPDKASEMPGFYNNEIDVTPAPSGISALRYTYGRALVLLGVMVGLVLLIACANIANLQLARAGGRQREFAIRAALGASRLRVIRQLLIESLMLSCAGAVIGLLVANEGCRLLVRLTSSRWQPSYLDLSPDLRVILFVLGTTLATAVLFGLAPALQLASVAPQNALKQNASASTGRRRLELTRFLVPLQVALSMVLLFGATLMLRSLADLLKQNLGFNKNGVLLVTTDLEQLNLKDAQLQQKVEDLHSRLKALPGVLSVSRSVVTPISGMSWQWYVIPEIGRSATKQVHVFFNLVSPEFFSTLDTALLAGRDFDQNDTKSAPLVAIVNQTAAHALFPGLNPIGRVYHDRSDPKHELVVRIIAVAVDAKYRHLKDPVPPTIYLPIAQNPAPFPVVGTYEVRFAGPSASMINETRKAIQTMDSSLSLEFSLLSDQVNDSLRQQDLIAGLSSLFSILALALACIGIYGVVACNISRRTSEIGVRMALGARRSDVLGMILRQSLLLVGSGIAAGIPAAILASRLMRSMLFGVDPGDPLTIALTIAAMTTTAILAAFGPARRASRIDPMEALRCE